MPKRTESYRDWLVASLKEPAHADAYREAHREEDAALRRLAEGDLAAAQVDRWVQSLSEYLDQSIETEAPQIVDGEALCCRIRSRANWGGPLSVSWEGILGLEWIDEAPHISASLFLFSGDTRLSPADQPGGFIELVFAPDGPSGTWSSLGWLKDEHGEYQSITRAPREGEAVRHG